MDNADHFFKAMGFVFNKEPVYDRYAACISLVNEYRKALLYNQVHQESNLAKFNEELGQNGMNEMIAEMQKQCAAFLGKLERNAGGDLLNCLSNNITGDAA